MVPVRYCSVLVVSECFACGEDILVPRGEQTIREYETWDIKVLLVTGDVARIIESTRRVVKLVKASLLKHHIVQDVP